jgi:hypothetical protein
MPLPSGIVEADTATAAADGNLTILFEKPTDAVVPLT